MNRRRPRRLPWLLTLNDLNLTVTHHVTPLAQAMPREEPDATGRDSEVLVAQPGGPGLTTERMLTEARSNLNLKWKLEVQVHVQVSNFKLKAPVSSFDVYHYWHHDDPSPPFRLVAAAALVAVDLPVLYGGPVTQWQCLRVVQAQLPARA